VWHQYTLKNINHMNPLSNLLFAVFIFTGLVLSQGAFASSSDHNVSGFAWSGMNSDEAIGWISFNSSFCDANGDGLSEGTTGCPATGAAVPNYGVNIDSITGAITGNAWAGVNSNEGIGWISFDDASGCPETNPANCKAWVTTIPDGSGNYQVNGWARVVSVKTESSNNGGWDGWIHLNTTACDTDSDNLSEVSSSVCPAAGNSVYGVYIDAAGDFKGFAWSDMVIGWMNFNSASCNGSNCTPISPYKVSTTVKFAPIAKIGCDDTQCSGGSCGSDPWVMYTPTGLCKDCIFKALNESEGNVKCTKWEVLGTSYSYTTSNSKADHTFQSDAPVGTNLTLRLTVSNNLDCSQGDISTATHLINIKREAQADFDCSFDDPNATSTPAFWQDCDTTNFKKKLVKGEKVYLKDVSIESEGGGDIVSSIWTVNGGTPDIDGNGIASFTTDRTNTIRLDVFDNNPDSSRNDTGRHNCKAVAANGKALPEWREINPIGMIWQNLVASIAKFFVIQ